MSVDRIDAVLGDYMHDDVIQSLSNDNEQAIFPEINFTCNGSIRSWTFGARWERDSDTFTELQIWRSSGALSYTKVGSTTIMTEESTTGVYQYPLSSPLPFQAGDILGYYQPATNRSQLGLVHEVFKSGKPGCYVYDLDNAPSQFIVSGSTNYKYDKYHVLVGIETGNI